MVLAVALSAGVAAVLGTAYWIFWMPGNARGLRPVGADPAPLIEFNLRAHVKHLAQTIGPRHHGRPRTLARTVQYIEQQWRDMGYQPQLHPYNALGTVFFNLSVDIPGRSLEQEMIVVGAHYDSVAQSPGANDNGSGIAALLELARLLRTGNLARTIRLVAFCNEELPYGGTDAQGSRQFAQHLREQGVDLKGMVALETIGYYTDRPQSQRYPVPLRWFYPATGDFLAFVADMTSRQWVTEAIAAFRRGATIPSEGIASPRLIADITRSDHSAFWDAGYPAFMVTDTAPFRYPAYHTERDTPDKLDYNRFARVVSGLHGMLAALAGTGSGGPPSK